MLWAPLMADPGENERLQPSLLDRLTDFAPTELQDSIHDRIIDIRRLREIVLRDLGWLLNTVNHEGDIGTDEFPNAAKSTLNYGITDISGKRAAESRGFELERMIHKAIEQFEPRIIPGSLSVTLSNVEDSMKSQIFFNIQADLWAQPVPVEVYLRTELDLASGEMRVSKG